MKAKKKSRTVRVKAWSIDVPWKNLCKENRRVPKIFYASKDAADHISKMMPSLSPVIPCTITYALPRRKN